MDNRSDRSLLLVRIAVAYVFVTSGALKLLFENQGPGRFAKIGLSPSLAYFVGTVEILCGLALAAGLFARLAALPLAITMVVAIVQTKLPLLWGAGPEPVAAMPKIGALAFANQARLDLTMLLACSAIALSGAGAISLDAWLAKRRASRLSSGAGRAQAQAA